MDASRSLPLVVCGPDGRPVGLLEENEKGFRKSIEHGHLWALHPGTGRLLPFHETVPVTMRERDGWYEAVLSEAHASPQGTANAGAGAGSRAGTGSRAGAGTPRADEANLGEVLVDLSGVIASRHAELPEGSYTTHLFTSGAEKIRKKTGEEAIELLLASSRETVVSESADLIYHLLVLLESEGIPLSELARELRSR